MDAGSVANEMVELEGMLGDYIDLEDGKGLTPLTEVNRVTYVLNTFQGAVSGVLGNDLQSLTARSAMMDHQQWCFGLLDFTTRLNLGK